MKKRFRLRSSRINHCCLSASFPTQTYPNLMDENGKRTNWATASRKDCNVLPDVCISYLCDNERLNRPFVPERLDRPFLSCEQCSASLQWLTGLKICRIRRNENEANVMKTNQKGRKCVNGLLHVFGDL